MAYRALQRLAQELRGQCAEIFRLVAGVHGQSAMLALGEQIYRANTIIAHCVDKKGGKSKSADGDDGDQPLPED